MSGLETPGARGNVGTRLPPETQTREQPLVECGEALIEPNRALVKIRDGRCLVPAEVVAGDEGSPQEGPDVDGADEEVAWVGMALAGIGSAASAEHLLGHQGFLRPKFLHAVKGTGWRSINTREINLAGVREFRLEKAVQEIKFNEYSATISGRVVLESAAVRLNSKLELTTRRLKAVDDGETRKKSLSALEPPRAKAKRRSRHAESADDTDTEDREDYGKKSGWLETLRAAAILFKEAGVREAASFTKPTDWDDEEEKKRAKGEPGEQ
ncbi:MAG: hypothetical protein SGPRY_002565 [Prymnesium sp.]